jgi:hypothetical protein
LKLDIFCTSVIAIHNSCGACLAEDIRRRHKQEASRWTAAGTAKTAGRASAAAKTAAARAAAAAFEVEKQAPVRQDVSCLDFCLLFLPFFTYHRKNVN